MSKKNEDLLDIFGNPVYSGNLVLLIDNKELQPRIVHSIGRGITVLKIKTETHNYVRLSKDDEWQRGYPWQDPYKDKIYVGGNWSNQKLPDAHKYHYEEEVTYVHNKSTFKLRMSGGTARNIVKIENPIFNMQVEGVAELFNLIDLAKESGYLPEEYKIGQRLCFDDSGSLSIYKESDREAE